MPKHELETNLTGFLQKQENIFLTQLHLLEAQPENEEVIRQLRLSVKKIRAIFRLLEKLTKGKVKAKPLLKPIRAIFKQLGQVRDGKLPLRFIGFYEPFLRADFSAFRHFILQNTDENLTASNLDFSSFDEVVFRKKQSILEKILFKKLKKNQLENRWKQHIKKLRKSIQKRVGQQHTEVLHEIRILFKEWFYLAKMLNKFTEQSEIKKQQLRQLKPFGRKIGVWHDCLLFKDTLDDFLEKYPQASSTDYKNLQAILDQECNLQEAALWAELESSVIPLMKA